MSENNPLIIPRNHKVEEALELACNKNNLDSLKSLLNYLKKPYENQTGISNYQDTSNSKGINYKTFCGT